MIVNEVNGYNFAKNSSIKRSPAFGMNFAISKKFNARKLEEGFNALEKEAGKIQFNTPSDLEGSFKFADRALGENLVEQSTLAPGTFQSKVIMTVEMMKNFTQKLAKDLVNYNKKDANRTPFQDLVTIQGVEFSTTKHGVNNSFEVKSILSAGAPNPQKAEQKINNFDELIKSKSPKAIKRDLEYTLLTDKGAFHGKVADFMCNPSNEENIFAFKSAAEIEKPENNLAYALEKEIIKGKENKNPNTYFEVIQSA